MIKWDVIVVGAGPAGSVAAATLAHAGKSVLLLERARFPRDKVCGDCLNPSVWPILQRLGLAERIRQLPHAPIESVIYEPIEGLPIRLATDRSLNPPIAIKRRDFDALLVERACEIGVAFQQETIVSAISGKWTLTTNRGDFSAPIVIAADGRNSTIARLTGRLGATTRDRVAVQCHFPDRGESAVRMIFRKDGYGGVAAVGNGTSNLCLVTKPERARALMDEAAQRFPLPANVEWRTIAPLQRADATQLFRDDLFLAGDAARVVEPFTGEGIFYAMRSGELAAKAIVSGDSASYATAHRAMYRGRLWINHLARLSVMRPALTSRILRILRPWPSPLSVLTSTVFRDPQT